MVPFEPLRRSVLAPTVSAADRARRVGTLSDYRILQTLGKGNFGTVSKIIRLRDKKLLVWKEVRYHNMSNRDRLQLVAEVNVLKMLDHPHIVQYVERIVDKPGMRLLIVMAYCVNGDLSELLRHHVMKQEFLAETMVLSTFSQLVDAIKYCHSRCILHRDIKPSNIFLDDNNNIRLGDFGLARMLPKDVLATTNVGTPYYQSPEMLLGQAYNEKSDIWALGCILYEMAMLKIPFDAKDYKHLMHIVCKGHFVPVSSAYSAELRQLVPWTLHKYSSARPTAEQLAQSPTLRDRIQYDKSQPKVFSPEEATGGLARYCKPKDAKSYVHDEVARDTADIGRAQTRDTADQVSVDREPSPDRPLGKRIQWADDLADLFVKKGADKENRPNSVQEKRIPALRECHSHGTLRLRMPRRPIAPLATPVAIAQQCAPGGNRVYSAKDSPGLMATQRSVTRGSPKRDTPGRSPSMSPLFPTPAGRIYPPPVWNSKPSLPLGRAPLARCHSNPRSALPKDTYPLSKAVDAALRRNPTYAIRTDIQTCTPDALPVVSPGAIAQPTLHRVETSLEELRCLRKDILSREGQLMEREAQLRDKEERLIKCEAHIRRKEHKYAHHAAIRAEQLDAREIRLLQWQDSIRLEPA